VLGALHARDLWPSRGNGVGAAPPTRLPARRAETVETRYEVRNPNGRLVAVHVREDLGRGLKRFRWEQPNGTPELGGLHTADLPLYGVEHLRERPGEPVILVEGQKAAQALRDAGRLAVGTVTGANGTPSDDVLRPLVGRLVYAWRDNDEPGRAHMTRNAQGLARLGNTPRWIEWAGAPEKGDAADFLAQHGAGEALDRLLAAAAPYVDAHTPERVVLVCLADVIAKPVRWLWRGRIPLGKLTVLDGDPNLGKSLLTVDAAARVTRNDTMPDSTRSDIDGPSGVVLLSAEDDLEDTIRPRLEAVGADCTRIELLVRVKDPQGERGPTIADIDALEEAIQKTRASLVIVDPLMAYLPDERDSHRDQDIRRALAPLAALAARTGVAVLVVRHLNKSSGGNPLYRGGGSIGIIGAARSGLLVALDPNDPDGGRRILAVTKANLAALPPALAFHVETQDDVPRIVWEGETSHTAEALLAVRLPEDERSALDETVEFLLATLAEHDLPAAEVKAAARPAGIAKRTLERARYRAGVVTRRQGFGPGAVYVWSLHARQDSHARQLVDNGEHGEHGPHDPRPHPHSTAEDSQRMYLRDLAESWRWPRIYIGWGETIAPGRETWTRFLTTAPLARIEWATADLQSLEVGQS